jgi:hypothetical protein
MAKVPFTKLKCKINEDSVPVKIGEEVIAVKQYLPVQEKLKLIGKVVTIAHDQDYNYSNPVKCDVYTELEMVFAYTNISFTDKQKEDLPKLYDMLKSSGVIDEMMKNLPEAEINAIFSGVWRSIESIYQYQNSVVGILDTIKNDYSNLKIDLNEIQEQLLSAEGMQLLKDIAPLIVGPDVLSDTE